MYNYNNIGALKLHIKRKHPHASEYMFEDSYYSNFYDPYSHITQNLSQPIASVYHTPSNYYTYTIPPTSLQVTSTPPLTNMMDPEINRTQIEEEEEEEENKPNDISFQKLVEKSTEIHTKRMRNNGQYGRRRHGELISYLD
eukprot:TRINITY_DN2045_c0_g1_i1.p1 TRINITY_DN2045_c0_g1~~TRINITY_DN2045_c0_g1_i1.p1  ORF type:complete len:141 (+),score=17.13 TRINITY_DN2045_c0_g1_i1:649-1071(+)